MARQNFGNTWWGEQWLNALTHIDYDNRLPRGRRYANNGSVRDLSVDGGVIKARVKGSRSQLYRIAIEAPSITKRKIKTLLDRIAADPVLIARLLNRELDPGLLELADQLGINIFPSRWKDLAMDCSCPDWAVPCKHLAAVVYLLSREIDSNPFLVFSLRGIDLTQALKSYGINIEQQAEAALPTVADLLQNDTATPPVDKPAELDHIDFSAVPELLEPLLNVLPAQPAFFAGGDLRAIYKRLITRVARQARRTLDSRSMVTHDPASDSFHADDLPHIEINNAFAVKISGITEVSDWPALVSVLGELAPARLPDLQPELAALYHLRLMSLHLLAAGAVSAQIFAPAAKEVALRWLPASVAPQVREQVQRLAQGIPAGTVGYRKGRSRVNLSAETQAIVLCSLFLDEFIQQWSGAQNEKPRDDKTLALFFSGGRARYDGPGESAMASGIQGWLARHHLVHHEHTPVLCLEETRGDDFSVAVAVDKRAAPAESALVPLSAVLADKSWAKARFGVLQDVSLLADFFPLLNQYVRAGASKPIPLAANELPALLFNTLPVIRLLGIRTLMPRALEKLLRPSLSLQVSGTKTEKSSGLLNAGALFDFDWKIALGGHLLTRSQFEKLVKSATGVIRFKSEYVYLDPREIERLRAQLEKPPGLAKAELLRVVLAGEYAGAAIGLDARARRIIRDLTEAGDVALPTGIDAELRPYQRDGYTWLYRNARIGLGSVLADDMGLGKTLQVIVFLQKMKQEGSLSKARALVVVPTSLITNWQKEIDRFAPALSVGVFHGSKRELSKTRPDLLLTSYGVARREATTLKTMAWQVVVVDEAQNIKNPTAAQTRAIKSIPARSFIAMSGTPVENRLSEYWSILDFANRGFLGSVNQFIKEYAVPIQTHHDAQVIDRFQRVTAPFLLRRLKSDKSIIDDLPDKIEQNQYCTLTPTQTALYESVVREGIRVVHGESDSFKRQGLVLQMILALKQVCNHPAQYLKQGQTEATLSGKAERLLELVDDIYANHEKVLIFTQFRETGELLSGWVGERYGQAPLFLHGGTTRKQRDAMVERFHSDRTLRVFVLSLKAGGTGLNLTAATNVIHYDLWWNPAVEAQATDRAYRIGQHSNVQVHRFITRDSFEERIDDLLSAKRKLAELTVGTGEKWIGNLSDEEIKSVFTLGRAAAADAK